MATFPCPGCSKRLSSSYVVREAIPESVDLLNVRNSSDRQIVRYLPLQVSLVSRMPLADFSSSLLGLFDWFFDERLVGLYIEGHQGLTFRKITRYGEFLRVERLGGLDRHQ